MLFSIKNAAVCNHLVAIQSWEPSSIYDSIQRGQSVSLGGISASGSCKKSFVAIYHLAFKWKRCICRQSGLSHCPDRIAVRNLVSLHYIHGQVISIVIYVEVVCIWSRKGEAKEFTVVLRCLHPSRLRRGCKRIEHENQIVHNAIQTCILSLTAYDGSWGAITIFS